MAEALLRSIGGEAFEVHSAGTVATHVRPEAIAVMAELGIDISGQTSKALAALLGEEFDWVITVCDDANESCPIFPGAGTRAHWSIDDPAAVSGSPDERLEAFRRARDDLRTRIESFVGERATATLTQ